MPMAGATWDRASPTRVRSKERLRASRRSTCGPKTSTTLPYRVPPIHLGHFLPDYTAYEELLDVFRRFLPIPILLDPKEGYAFTRDDLEQEILGRGLSAILASNPCNPTGKLVEGDTLAGWVDTARHFGCALLLDEFYSHYVWTGNREIVSAAQYVEDVDEDPVVIFDGLTKNWRYPGFRVIWILGPKRVIESAASAGSFLDGGGVAPMQRAAVELVQEVPTLAETRALQKEFRAKRELLVEGLKDVGVRFDLEPQGTFYAWGDAWWPSSPESDPPWRRKSL